MEVPFWVSTWMLVPVFGTFTLAVGWAAFQYDASSWNSGCAGWPVMSLARPFTCSVNESDFYSENGGSYAATRGRQTVPSTRTIGYGLASTGRIRPSPGCELVLLSDWEVSQ